ncbi:hypothetical protein AURDEDRAFT_188968 [Auricularia subglabra TFB-10046 SS5]|uniref:Uncharacterized protein n=1 Tax=Auricularia subglabra (strain TFB-10046 / SS5) TaxID=717982 RepID=J0WRM2_AURST|nr:hypothetical protein AURDEDRAFT_188968 [Auricularia subglabra TFB-10046 SS5]
MRCESVEELSIPVAGIRKVAAFANTFPNLRHLDIDTSGVALQAMEDYTKELLLPNLEFIRLRITNREWALQFIGKGLSETRDLIHSRALRHAQALPSLRSVHFDWEINEYTYHAGKVHERRSFAASWSSLRGGDVPVLEDFYVEEIDCALAPGRPVPAWPTFPQLPV